MGAPPLGNLRGAFEEGETMTLGRRWLPMLVGLEALAIILGFVLFLLSIP